MARPIEPTPTLTGRDAERFLKEKERIESLRPGDPEYEERKRFFAHCREVYAKSKPWG